jgi:hypothetical protein
MEDIQIFSQSNESITRELRSTAALALRYLMKTSEDQENLVALISALRNKKTALSQEQLIAIKDNLKSPLNIDPPIVKNNKQLLIVLTKDTHLIADKYMQFIHCQSKVYESRVHHGAEKIILKGELSDDEFFAAIRTGLLPLIAPLTIDLNYKALDTIESIFDYTGNGTPPIFEEHACTGNDLIQDYDALNNGPAVALGGFA